jgi:hypothetical protein
MTSNSGKQYERDSRSDLEAIDVVLEALARVVPREQSAALDFPVQVLGNDVAWIVRLVPARAR